MKERSDKRSLKLNFRLYIFSSPSQNDLGVVRTASVDKVKLGVCICFLQGLAQYLPVDHSDPHHNPHDLLVSSPRFTQAPRPPRSTIGNPYNSRILRDPHDLCSSTLLPTILSRQFKFRTLREFDRHPSVGRIQDYEYSSKERIGMQYRPRLGPYCDAIVPRPAGPSRGKGHAAKSSGIRAEPWSK